MYGTRSSSPLSTALVVVVTVMAILAGAVIAHEALKLLPRLAEIVVAHAGAVFGLMLGSLGAVVLSMIVPDRLGRVLLTVGAVGFFAGLTAALLHAGRL